MSTNRRVKCYQYLLSGTLQMKRGFLLTVLKLLFALIKWLQYFLKIGPVGVPSPLTRIEFVFDRRIWRWSLRLIHSSPWRKTPRRPRLPHPPSCTRICLRLAQTAKNRWLTGRPFIRGRATPTSSAPPPAFWIFSRRNKLRRPATSASSEEFVKITEFHFT